MPKHERDDATINIRGPSSVAVEERKGILLLIQRDYEFLLFREAEDALSSDDPWFCEKTRRERNAADIGDADYPLKSRRIRAPFTSQERRVWRTAVLSRSLDPNVYTIEDMLYVSFVACAHDRTAHVKRVRAGLAAPPPEVRDKIDN
jgi:hypothetical protein